MCIKQINVGFDNFSYIIFDKEDHVAAIVDPSYEIKDAIDFLRKNNLDLKYIINTHHHNDHTSKNYDIKKLYPKSKLIVSKENLKGDLKVSDDYEIKIGKQFLHFILTPGHTQDGICIIVNNKAILTGDTLFIGNCGRTDLLDGDINNMFESLQRIKKLSDDLIIYPGHNYGNKPYDTLANQKKTNQTLIAKNIDEFLKIS